MLSESPRWSILLGKSPRPTAVMPRHLKPVSANGSNANPSAFVNTSKFHLQPSSPGEKPPARPENGRRNGAEQNAVQRESVANKKTTLQKKPLRSFENAGKPITEEKKSEIPAKPQSPWVKKTSVPQKLATYKKVEDIPPPQETQTHSCRGQMGQKKSSTQICSCSGSFA